MDVAQVTMPYGEQLCVQAQRPAVYVFWEQHTVVSPKGQSFSSKQHLLAEQYTAIEQLQLSC
jgi:hypothetical protein